MSHENICIQLNAFEIVVLKVFVQFQYIKAVVYMHRGFVGGAILCMMSDVSILHRDFHHHATDICEFMDVIHGCSVAR